jgi:thioredoxin 2
MIATCHSCSQSNRIPAARLRDQAKCASCKASLLPLTHPLAVKSAEDFDELIRDSPGPVLVDFWAAWCGPCRAVAPEFEKIAAQRKGEIIVAKVDTEALPAVSARFGIQGIPTMIVFHRGKEISRTSGAMPASAIVEQLGLQDLSRFSL